MLGVMLEPRLDSPINANNKEEWDYVLRKCFVTEAQSLRHGLKNLAFGGEGLEEKIGSEGSTRFAGRPVSCDKLVRNLEVEEWARVVDVFKKWAFKPTVSWCSELAKESS
jgi:16S rRNA A1518/A1519 N6-dimethyltransferase RsmA/KsgA/DIM1 with predicted DNA glycosylase/AP lyase activity